MKASPTTRRIRRGGRHECEAGARQRLCRVEDATGERVSARTLTACPEPRSSAACREVAERLRRLREELRVVDEQLEALAGEADDTRLRAPRLRDAPGRP